LWLTEVDMPRLTDQHHLQTHRQLKRFWEHAKSAYGHLTPTEQWQLHDFYQPSKDLTDIELLKHRNEITIKRPSLPQQAGRALAKLYAAAAYGAARGVRLRATATIKPAKRTIHRVRAVQVYGVVKPEPDLKKLARALVQIAIDMQNKNKPDSERPDGLFSRCCPTGSPRRLT
jgi:hypothetical protein